MGVRNPDREVIEVGFQSSRYSFTAEIEQGLNCSPFQSEAVLEVVKRGLLSLPLR